MLGGYTALSTKGVASLLSGSLWRALTFPIIYLLVFVLVTTAVFQIRYLNRALQRFDSTQVIPTQFVLFTISVIVGSAVLYRDFESANAERVGKFIGGCALTFSGVYLITSGRGGQTDGEDEDEIDVEEGIGLVDEEAEQDTFRDEGSEMATTSVGGDKFLVDGPDGTRSPQRSSNGYGPLSRLNSTASNRSRPLTPPSAGLVSPLTDNPWMSSQDRLTPRPPMSQYATTSSAPGGASESQPSTPRPDMKHRYLSTTNERPSGKSRKSLVGLFPGPISSPLSSSLSAVVADTLRRGLDSPTRLRQQRLRLKKSQKLGGEEAGPDTSLPGLPLKATELNAKDDVRRTAFKTRSKSLSDALGSVFHPNRKGERDDQDADTSGKQRAEDGERHGGS